MQAKTRSISPFRKKTYERWCIWNKHGKTKKQAWRTFKDVVKKLPWKQDPNCKDFVEKMIRMFKDLGCNMSNKVHLLHSHLSYFPDNPGAVNEEQAE